ncbi:MAG: hypothetical protein U0Q55_17330 [Vicinamibacterales bacterium]
MSVLASRRWRLFLVIWIVYSLHFATNVVREHYPAFSIVQHGTFRVDEYQGFHADIFRHRDGHSVIGNQVLVSALAAVPLFVFEPVLSRLEQYSKAKVAREGVKDADYRIDKPNRVNFFRLVKERGLDLRFGAATVVTSVFFMAPITAAFLVYFFGVLRRRGLSPAEASVITFLGAFCTPLFFRQSTLNHNMFVMYAMFIAFCVLWDRGADDRLSVRQLALAGFFGGLTLATDYVGVIILPLLWGYFVVTRARQASWWTAILESYPMVLGSLPPIAFLLYSQWAMYGNPFLPGQYWMPDQNIYTNVGARGFTLPDPEIFIDSLIGSDYGMYSWGPLLLLSLWPSRGVRDEALVLPRVERRWLLVTWWVFLLFTSANQYSRLQFNSGFRYLIPLVPFLLLAVADTWRRLPASARVAVAGVTLVHSWVLTVFREPVVRSWRLFLDEGIQLPWYRVLSLTSAPGNPWLGNWWVPALLIAGTMAFVVVLWRYGARLEKAHGL